MKDIELTNNFQVEEIGEYEDWVYDLEIENNHNFFANDILLHNSLFLRFGHFLDKIVGDPWHQLSDKEKTNIVIRLSKVIERYIDKRSYEEIQKQDYNSSVSKDEFAITFKQEIVCKRALYIKKKKYGFHVVNKEGNPKDDISVTGLDIVRSETPTLFRYALTEILGMILRGSTDEEIRKVIDQYRKKAKKVQPYELSINTSINNISNYLIDDGKEVKYIKGTPFHLKGLANYKNLLRKLNIENKYPEIQEGDKARVIYLKDNQYMMESVAFDIWPEEFDKNGIVYDPQIMVEKGFIKKIRFLLSPMKRESLIDKNKNTSAFFG